MFLKSERLWLIHGVYFYSHFGLRISVHALIVVHHRDMVLPFEVTCSAWDLYFVLLVLLKAPGGQKVYETTREHILGYIKFCRFDDLQKAVLASLAARRNEVRLLRNATLASRDPHCIIPKNQTVRLSSFEGPWRLRAFHNDPPDFACPHTLFVLGDGARLSIDRMHLEAESRYGSPYVALLVDSANNGEVTLSDDVTINGYVEQGVRDKITVMRYCPDFADLAEAKPMESNEIAAGTFVVIIG